jgi:DNA-binding NarL/FixJ family response regulator
MLEDVDVAILDLSLPDGSGAELIPELHTVNPNAKALVFSFSVDPDVADHLLRRGATAAVSKLDGVSELLETVKRIQ